MEELNEHEDGTDTGVRVKVPREENELRSILNDLGMSQAELARRMVDLGDDRSERNILRSIQRQVAGHARLSGEMRALLGMMLRPAKPFEFKLTEREIAILKDTAADGGHRNFHRRILRELQDGSDIVTFTDEQLGELIRYMTRYGSSAYRTRLHFAFKRSIDDLFHGTNRPMEISDFESRMELGRQAAARLNQL